MTDEQRHQATIDMVETIDFAINRWERRKPSKKSDKRLVAEIVSAVNKAEKEPS